MSPYNAYTPYPYYPQMYQQPIQQPIQQSIQQPMAQQTIPAPPTYVLGKTVNSPADIMAADVPMGAQKVFFPQADGKVIYARAWNSNGLIDPKTYVLQEDLQPEAKEDPLSSIRDQLTRIEEKLAKLEG